MERHFRIHSVLSSSLNRRKQQRSNRLLFIRLPGKCLRRRSYLRHRIQCRKLCLFRFLLQLFRPP